MWSQTTNFKPRAIALACAALLAGCGGGGGGSSDGGTFQAIDFNYPGGLTVGAPGTVVTTTLKATASSGGPVTFSSNTPDTCSVSGTTLSLLKAGECSVTASQAGANGYAPASTRQLFVIPKIKQFLVFRNPGAQPLDSTPLQLTATSSVAGKTVTFASSTPSVCTVSGTTLTKVGNGICTVTATQAGDDYYASIDAVKNIPIGTATSPTLTFLSGYKDSSNTKEGGGISAGAGTSENGWWCEGGDVSSGHCTTTAAADGNSLTFGFALRRSQPTTASTSISTYWNLGVFAGGLTSLAKGLDTTTGLHIDAQSTMKFNFGENTEWFTSSNNKVNAQLILGHYVAVPNGKDDKGNPKFNDCNVTLQATFTPTAAAPTAYSLNLKNDFTISQACGLTGLDLWNELQDYPISEINFSAASMNVNVPDSGSTATYTTQATLTGPVTFQ
jgi:hypothetical protein